MIAASMIAALLGVLAGAGGVLALRGSDRNPHLYWLLGLVALCPAWAIVFVGLLGPAPGLRLEAGLIVAFVLSSAAGLLGVILTEAAVRRLGESGAARRPALYWLLGVVALAPAWVIALLGFAAAPD